MCRYGFSPTKTEVRQIVYDYLESNLKTVAFLKIVDQGSTGLRHLQKGITYQ